MSRRVIIADDHPVFLLGLRTVLATLPENYQVVGEAHDVTALFSLLEEKEVDMLITDFNMPGDNQIDGLRMINRIRERYPSLPIVVITMISDRKIIASLIDYKVKAILNKNSLSHELVKGLYSTTGCHEPYLSEQFLESPGEEVVKALTGKELEVIKLLGQGLSVNDIAARLYRTKQTISAQKISAMKKLGLENEAALYNYLHQVGLGL
ncbi:Transcriptional regulatory protein RcsB [Photorhabdus australis subsp. thailandensis]|uniref:Transcriptional regulatory protein RcsB n=1 Tax=Photorhabdus australis subsp. thailandensis TaxID=2805096 RepID=A0A1C0U219_9GAMM|nr:response regulator transcription factor [Photorhabdus australis]OCQ51990.1 Transcriptional regulatory protein RcsB [Photorhabdus australis subsp. thailandensis]